MNRPEVVLTILLLILTNIGCSSGYDYPRDVPQRSEWWVDPVAEEALTHGREVTAGDIASALAALDEAQCQAEAARAMTIKAPGQVIIEAASKQVADAAGQPLSESTKGGLVRSLVDDKHQEVLESVDGVTAAEVAAAAASSDAAHPLAPSPLVPCGVTTSEAACIEAAASSATSNITKTLESLPISIRAGVLDAYRTDLLVALDTVAQAPSIEAGLKEHRQACQSDETPFPNLLRSRVIPSLRTNWKWDGARGSSILANTKTFDEVFFHTCATANRIHLLTLRHLKRAVDACQ